MRIYTDFNTAMMDGDGQVLLNLDVAPNRGIQLHAGEAVTLYDEELEVDGTVTRDERHAVWLATPHWATRRDVDEPVTR